MAYSQMYNSSEVNCTDKTFGQNYSGAAHHNAFKPIKHDSHSTMACQTTCHGTTGTQTQYGGKPQGQYQTHGNGYGYGYGASQDHGYNGGASQVQGYDHGGAGQVHGYGNGGATQFHGYGHGGASQVHGYTSGGQYHGASAAGMACYGNGRKVKRTSGRKHRDGHGGDSSCSDSESDDDECRRRC